jgi:hypothetical protein
MLVELAWCSERPRGHLDKSNSSSRQVRLDGHTETGLWLLYSPVFLQLPVYLAVALFLIAIGAFFFQQLRSDIGIRRTHQPTCVLVGSCTALDQFPFSTWLAS